MPGGGNPDYSSVSTWEAASDNDLAAYGGPVILDCYDSQEHTQNNVTISGATNTSASVYREVRSSPSCSTPYAGKKGTGANFLSTAGVFSLNEIYGRLSNFYAEVAGNSASLLGTIKSVGGVIGRKFINLSAKAANVGAGGADSFFTGGIAGAGSGLFFNCVSVYAKRYGFAVNTWNAADVYAFVCCTAVNGDGTGFYSVATNAVAVLFSCYAGGNAADFGETYWDAPSGWNASKDNTSDLGGTAGDNYKNGLDLLSSGDIDGDGLATADDLYENGAAGSRYGRNPYNDLSESYDFDDFLKNDQSGESASKKDIAGVDRPTPDTADVSWNIGASEYEAASTTTTTPTTLAPTTLEATTSAPSTSAPTTGAPTTLVVTTEGPTTSPPTTVIVTTLAPTTLLSTTLAPTTLAPSMGVLVGGKLVNKSILFRRLVQ